MAIVIVLVLLVVGSVLFHFLSPWYLNPIASNWGAMDDTISITFWVTGIVFVAVNLFVAYAVFRFRFKKDRRAAYEPENKKLEVWLTVVTAVGVAAMLAPGLFVYAKFVDVPKEAAVVEILGKQWHWSYRFPGKDGKLGIVNASHMSDDNLFGLDPNDPAGQDDILISSQELHLPINKPVKVLLRSTDVLHNFTVPQFRVKMDLVPGLMTYVWFTPTRTGKFDLLCNELCGLGHYVMRGSVVVDEEAEFDAWLASHPTFAQSSTRVAGDAVAGQSNYAVCVACHGAQGEGNSAMNAPKLSGQSDWYLKRQLEYYKSGARGTHEKDVYGQVMAPMAATLSDEAAIDNVIAYIRTLPDTPAARTVNQSSNNGRKIFVATCAACHGAAGQGIKATNAPRLAGMSDWYLITQMKNFKERTRGAHPKDIYGPQMTSMAAILADDQSITDLVAYINTLE